MVFVDIAINTVTDVKKVDDDAVLLKQRDEAGTLSVVAITKADLLRITEIMNQEW